MFLGVSFLPSSNRRGAMEGSNLAGFSLSYTEKNKMSETTPVARIYFKKSFLTSCVVDQDPDLKLLAGSGSMSSCWGRHAYWPFCSRHVARHGRAQLLRITLHYITCRQFVIFEGCLDSNPECCRSKLARYRLSHPSLFWLSHPSLFWLSHPSLWLSHQSQPGMDEPSCWGLHAYWPPCSRHVARHGRAQLLRTTWILTFMLQTCRQKWASLATKDYMHTGTDLHVPNMPPDMDEPSCWWWHIYWPPCSKHAARRGRAQMLRITWILTSMFQTCRQTWKSLAAKYNMNTDLHVPNMPPDMDEPCC